jgi:hypothetical protein
MDKSKRRGCATMQTCTLLNPPPKKKISKKLTKINFEMWPAQDDRDNENNA